MHWNPWTQKAEKHNHSDPGKQRKGSKTAGLADLTGLGNGVH